MFKAIKSFCFLLLIYHQRSSIANVIQFEDHGLYEGYRCNLTSGNGKGKCTKAIDCPEKVMDILYEKFDTVGHCGYSKFDEIVCCPNPFSRPSPANVACETFKKFAKSAGISEERVKFRGKKIPDPKFEAPFIAALGYLDRNNNDNGDEMRYYCGGTLISKNHVLTAAHCVSNLQNLIPVEVMLGTTDLGDTHSEWIQRVSISKIITHPRYARGQQYYNDIAILKLSHPVEFSRGVLPACLETEPFENEISQELNLKSFGWPEVEIMTNESKSLMMVDHLTPVEAKECSKNYENIVQLPVGIDSRIICAANLDRQSGNICQHDSGGPLLIQDSEFPVIAGVKSFGLICQTNKPAGYTSVYKYSYWIEDQVWGHT